MVRTKLSLFCEKLIEAGWLAAVVVVPLYFNIYSARTFEPDKITFLRAIVSLMILAWIVMIVEQGRASVGGDSPTPLAEHFRGWLKQPLFLPTLLLILAYIFSTIFSISPKVSFYGSYQRMQGTYSFLTYIVLFALIAGNLRSREQVERLVTTIIITSVPVSLYGIIQKYGLDPLPWAGDVTTRVASTLGNAIFVASYLIMVMPLTMSRLVESMIAIIKEEKASWGHTILAAIYIFALAVQALTVIFSQSRGPMLGILGGSFVMGLLFILILRRLHSDSSRLSLAEVAQGLGFIIPLGLAGGALGGLGYVLGSGAESLFISSGYQVENVGLLGAVLGGLLGFLGLYTYMASSGRGWRWLWVSWIGIGGGALLFVVLLNIRGTAFDVYLDPIRQIPYVSRLGNVAETSGSGRVRILIWESALDLIAFHEPLGITGDEEAGLDPFNMLRPLFGYGPESMFNAFAYVYPPELAHVENRGSSADRSHNETMDSLVITGIFGFLAFYFLMVNLLFYGALWLGWAPDSGAKKRLIALLIIGGVVGAIIPYLVENSFTFSPLGLPLGLVVGLIIHLVWQGFVQQSEPEAVQETPEGEPAMISQTLLLIGLLGAVVGHFIEVHFVFSIAATYTYFWAYAGLMVALARLRSAETAAEPVETPQPEVVAATPSSQTQAASASRRGRKGRGRRGGVVSGSRSGGSIYATGPESWETWIGSQGLAMAIILIILTFDFITPQFEFNLSNEKSASLFWMMSITWGIGFAIALSNLAIQKDKWNANISWGRAILLYSITSLSYFLFYMLAHRLQFGQRITVSGLDDIIQAAGVLTKGLVLFYLALLLLMVILSITLSWRQMRNRVFWRAENWWLYPPLVAAILTVIWLKNIDVVRADIFLKEGERYRNSGQWNEAVALHETAQALDKDEDFYYLMLALDYQLMAQDGNLTPEQRQVAWQKGEEIALEARGINPYNPDNTGNMGRYYFTLGQIFSREYFQQALTFFEKAVALAPSNVIYHNLWAQTHYILQEYDAAIDRLQTSISIDPNYSPSWLLLGDTYAAMGKLDEALMAHTEAMRINSGGGGDGFAAFADQFLDQRLNFYISAGRGDDIIAVMQQIALERPDNPQVQQAIGRAYSLMGQQDKAALYFEQARTLGDQSPATLKNLANLYLASNAYDQAIPTYQALLESNPNDVEALSGLAYIYAQQGQTDQAIEHNQRVLQQIPEDYDSLKNLSILYQQKGLFQEALEFARRAQAAASEAERPTWDQLIANLENQIAAGN